MPHGLNSALCVAVFLFTASNDCESETAESTETSFPPEIAEVQIPSSIDQSPQPSLAYFPPPSEQKNATVPLLVGLHSWSGDYRQTANIPMAEWCVAKRWAFIHPNFRGPNWTPEACGSDLAVQDVVDAVNFMRAKGAIDESRIYLMGSSGGGHMSLLVAGRHPTIWAGVSAWVPITDLSAWFFETRVSGRRYAVDMLKSIGSPPSQSSLSQKHYQHRSPLPWLAQARSVPIDINAGIHDGHEGSVPISHSLTAFNHLVPETERIAETDILEMTGKRRIPESLIDPNLRDSHYGEKRPLFRKTAANARITIFDGGHEGIPNAGLSWLSQQRKRRP